MKAFYLLIPIMSVVILLSEAACCSKIIDDTKSPVATITIIYKVNGQEIINSYNSRPSQPEGGYQVSIPRSIAYQVWFGSKDSGLHSIDVP